MINPSVRSGKSLFLFFLAIWFILNALQAAFTNLDPDEAYYWMYSKSLAWGYFDHPPAIATLIKLGYTLIPNELGVRIFTILAQIGSFYGIWILLGKPQERKQVWTLIALLVAMPMLHIYGFVATPDAPLLLFTVWFLVLYQRFIEKDSWANTLWLGACMAALLYSKYHGVLLILFVLLSNWRLLLNPKFYIASIFGALLFFPHLYWQYSHDFPSFRYHLVERDDPYELKHTITYVLNQLVIFNPFLFPMLLAALFRQTTKDALYRAFIFLLVGFWGFFFYASFKGHVEPQWTVILCIPLVVIGWRYAIDHSKFDLWVRRFALLTAILLLGVRIGLLEGNPFQLKTNFHRTVWVEELKNMTRGASIVFENSYRDPSMFTFYTGQQAYTFTDANYRRNQFDIWNWEKDLQNQTVVIAAQDSLACNNCEQVKLTRKILKMMIADSLQISQKVHFALPPLPAFKAGASISLSTTIQNPYEHTIHFGTGNMPLQVVAIFYAPEKERIKSAPIVTFQPALQQLKPGQSQPFKAQFTIPDSLHGAYIFGLGIETGELAPAFNSALFKVNIN